MFYPFVFFLLAIPNSPGVAKLYMDSPIGYESLAVCTARLTYLNAELVSGHPPDTVRIVFTGCGFKDTPSV